MVNCTPYLKLISPWWGENMRQKWLSKMQLIENKSQFSYISRAAPMFNEPQNYTVF